MPRRTIRCRRLFVQNGTIYARWSDKTENEFDSRAEMKRWVRSQLTDQVLKAIALGAVLEDSADGTPLNQCDGKRITLDWAATPLLTVLDSAT